MRRDEHIFDIQDAFSKAPLPQMSVLRSTLEQDIGQFAIRNWLGTDARPRICLKLNFRHAFGVQGTQYVAYLLSMTRQKSTDADVECPYNSRGAGACRIQMLTADGPGPGAGTSSATFHFRTPGGCTLKDILETVCGTHAGLLHGVGLMGRLLLWSQFFV